MKKKAYAEMFAVEDTHWWYVSLHDLVKVLCNTLFPQQTLKILDAGCGTGGLLSSLSKLGHDLVGFDYSDDALHYCCQRGLNNVSKADINNWTPKPNTYDLITSLDVLYHKWIQDEITVLRTLASGLKDDGLIIANYPAFHYLGRKHDKVVMTRERYTKKSLKKKFAEAGLAPILCSYRLPHAFLFLLLLRFYETFTKNNNEEKSDVAHIPSNLINRSLIQIGKFENHLIAHGVSIPFGSSLFIVAKKAT